MERSEIAVDALNDGSMLYSIRDKEYLRNRLNASWNHGKVDIVMWAKNGDKTLEQVLKQIDYVIPKEIVNKRILINDHSFDGTSTIAFIKGWTPILNDGHGISDAANNALKHVTTEWFCSFEQDVVLSPFWWGRISKLVGDKVAAVSGVRFLPRSHPCFGIEYYNACKQKNYGQTLDNTLWNTAKLREIGGFPKLAKAGIDTYVSKRFDSLGYKWLVDTGVQSTHLHRGLENELERYRFYGQSLPELYTQLGIKGESASWLLQRLIKSPISAYRMSRIVGDNRLMYSYPLVRLYWLLGYLRGRGEIIDAI